MCRNEVAKLGRDYQTSGVGIVAISANDETNPDDRPESLAEMARELKFTFPYLFDESQETARAYDAQCTPDFFLYDAQGKLVYRGQLDDSRPGNGIPVTGKDLRAALDALIAGKPISANSGPASAATSNGSRVPTVLWMVPTAVWISAVRGR